MVFKAPHCGTVAKGHLVSDPSTALQQGLNASVLNLFGLFARSGRDCQNSTEF
jgi:hypothetical protein